MDTRVQHVIAKNFIIWMVCAYRQVENKQFMCHRVSISADGSLNHVPSLYWRWSVCLSVVI